MLVKEQSQPVVALDHADEEQVEGNWLLKKVAAEILSLLLDVGLDHQLDEHVEEEWWQKKVPVEILLSLRNAE